MESWSRGELDAPTYEEMCLIHAAARGGISVLDEILKLDYQSIRGNNE